MSKVGNAHYEPVSAFPVKSFFVSMLTRDIKLEDAILDLLDNCVDGILRSEGRSKGSKPFEGFRADIALKKDCFSITDNCGGIPWNLHGYAFRMGRPDDRPKDTPGGVGVYGIGMKRAIFKIGKHCLISTQNGNDRYEVEISPRWIDEEDDWNIPVRAAKKAMKQDGTEIVIGDLYPNIAARFSIDGKTFMDDLEQMIAGHYAFIIEKGLTVRLNGHVVKAQPTQLVFTKGPPKQGAPRISPYFFKTKADGVEVFLAVGFTRPLPSEDEITKEQEATRYSSLGAGWTIVCNDRAVLYCDRTELTGWGEATVPRYHTQFIAISGIVEFRADDPAKLPTTTTKRGIDASSRLYLQIKNKMRDGMKMFTDYTYKWKGREEESKRQIGEGDRLSLSQLKAASTSLQFRNAKKSDPPGQLYRPELPFPKKLESHMRRIAFVRKAEEVAKVARHVFDDGEGNPSKVGEKCFELILREARR